MPNFSAQENEICECSATSIHCVFDMWQMDKYSLISVFRALGSGLAVVVPSFSQFGNGLLATFWRAGCTSWTKRIALHFNVGNVLRKYNFSCASAELLLEAGSFVAPLKGFGNAAVDCSVFISVQPLLSCPVQCHLMCVTQIVTSCFEFCLKLKPKSYTVAADLSD